MTRGNTGHPVTVSRAGAKATMLYVRLRTVEQMWRLTVTLRLPCP